MEGFVYMGVVAMKSMFVLQVMVVVLLDNVDVRCLEMDHAERGWMNLGIWLCCNG